MHCQTVNLATVLTSCNRFISDDKPCHNQHNENVKMHDNLSSNTVFIGCRVAIWTYYLTIKTT